jgi:hypothetical protein
MKKIKLIAGIFWAFICLVMVLILFPGLNGFSGSLAKLPFMKINPNYTGGEVARQLDHGLYTICIRKPVFDGLTGERKKGFVQVDWKGTLPDEINDSIDIDNDNMADFLVHINRSGDKTEVNPINPKIGGVIVSTPVSYGWSLRVAMKK